MLLDSKIAELVMSSEFARKQRFKLKKQKDQLLGILEEDGDKCDQGTEVEHDFENAIACTP